MGLNRDTPVETDRKRLMKIQIGNRVITDDGAHGVVVKIRGDEVEVLHPEGSLGRGPWIFQRNQLCRRKS